ncbi:hypothetical protein BKA67DRAFT_118301 [Truncatella angustata]|uniref:Uncharacterized protein n=1 Tax=Truncatella angustata TaxID=152316 RepID=A0A9P8RJS9_9PEZI|nr:uncharacterized protein BKA67DRAFT_118301 [Truncatella angustata]KAH6645583.1 hypothetical protein BKA67DRAFT_118301 [Truncatella angustata]
MRLRATPLSLFPSLYLLDTVRLGPHDYRTTRNRALRAAAVLDVSIVSHMKHIQRQCWKMLDVSCLGGSGHVHIGYHCLML